MPTAIFTGYVWLRVSRRYLAPSAQRQEEKKRVKLELWFEFASTYSYLTVSRVEPLLAETEVDLVWRPFLLGPIFRDRGMNSSPFVLDPIKGRYMWRDMERRCEKYDLPFIRPDVFPMNGLKAARIMTAALEQTWCGCFARSVFSAQFASGADISDEEVLRNVLQKCDVAPEPWLERAEHNEIKDALRAATNRARSLGVFGAPCMVVGDELFWGDDRLEDAIAFAREARSQERQNAAASP
ncbi:2-hydroxychromene-2-carboxylate isomerase [Lutimaribacter marinistellae]|uniref:2-hydroxychromene-2-carboxylate isomerase n=1 Tax=Lutimaribacter marinistellae TaxID=1820329 RepID=A0ABV7TA94_9RHOB